MSCNYYELPHPGIQTLNPYIPGKSIEELMREQGLTQVIKLASNENPLGCSPLVKEVLANLADVQIASYPSPAYHPLLHKLSQKSSVSEHMLTLSNGSDFLFFLLLVTFALHNDKHILTHEHAFISYRIQAQTLGIPVSIASLKSDWQVNIEAMIEACDQTTAIIFLANPNNPTGSLMPYTEIKRLLNAIPRTTLLVLDEAYYEYSWGMNDKTGVRLVEEHANLVITRTFSKAYGLAGLRLGYAIAQSEVTELLHRVQLPFIVNQAALVAANAALDDEAFIGESVALNNQGKEQLIQGLNLLKLDYIPSSANFVTVDCKTNAEPIYQNLLKEGIIVRPLHAYGLANFLRISIGTIVQNERFLATLSTLVNNQ